MDAYETRRPSGALRFRCKACGKDFSITSGTLFASHKLPLKGYLAAVAIFCNEVKGKSMLAMSRDLGLSYKAAFVLCHKMREAMAEEMKGRTVGGNGKTAEIDSAVFGGYVKPHNLRTDVARRGAERGRTARFRMGSRAGTRQRQRPHRDRRHDGRESRFSHNLPLSPEICTPTTRQCRAFVGSCVVALLYGKQIPGLNEHQNRAEFKACGQSPDSYLNEMSSRTR